MYININITWYTPTYIHFHRWTDPSVDGVGNTDDLTFELRREKPTQSSKIVRNQRISRIKLKLLFPEIILNHMKSYDRFEIPDIYIRKYKVFTKAFTSSMDEFVLQPRNPRTDRFRSVDLCSDRGNENRSLHHWKPKVVKLNEETYDYKKSRPYDHFGCRLDGDFKSVLITDFIWPTCFFPLLKCYFLVEKWSHLVILGYL